MNKLLDKIYDVHHSDEGRLGFSILEENRGRQFAKWIGKDKQVLDIGCRDGTLTAYFADGNDVTGVDIDSSALQKAQEKLDIETHNFNLNDDWDKLNGQKYDVVVAGEVLEHVYFPEKVTGKVAQHLKPGGIFIGSVPNAFHLKNRVRYLLGNKKDTPLADPTHINDFHISELREMLNDHFDQVEVTAIGQHEFLAKLHPGWFGFDLVFRAKL